MEWELCITPLVPLHNKYQARTQQDDGNDDELDGDELEEVQLVEAEEAGADRAAEERYDHQHEVGQPLQLPAPRPSRPPRRRHVRLCRIGEFSFGRVIPHSSSHLTDLGLFRST